MLLGGLGRSGPHAQMKLFGNAISFETLLSFLYRVCTLCFFSYIIIIDLFLYRNLYYFSTEWKHVTLYKKFFLHLYTLLLWYARRFWQFHVKNYTNLKKKGYFYFMWYWVVWRVRGLPNNGFSFKYIDNIDFILF